MNRSVYIVEDDDAVRTSLQALLSLREDIAIHSYKSAESFLDAIARDDVGVLLVDFRMDGMTGLDLLERLRTGVRRFAPIMLTAQGDIALAVRAMKAGAIDFMEKPCESARLLASIDAGFAELEQHRETGIAVVEARARIQVLSPRERTVLGGLIHGWSNKIIANKLDLSPRTVEIHRANLMAKLQVRRLSEALRLVFTAGLLDELERSMTAPQPPVG